MVIYPEGSEEKQLLKEMEKEISVLSSLGVEDYEIKYLIHLKRKREAAIKWEN